MLVIDVELLFGTIRAGSPDDLAASGSGDPGEWPPSPARLLSALVAADGTGERCKVTTGEELVAIEAASPPRILCDGDEKVLRSPLEPRYVVVDAKAENTMQDYPARTGAEVRLGSRLSPFSPLISYVWDDLTLADSLVAAVRRRAARVGYLGCADSPARLRVRTDASRPGSSMSHSWEAAKDGDVDLPVPYDGFVADLDDLYERFTGGEWVRRAWLPPVRAPYRSPSRRKAAQSERPEAVVLWFRLATPLAGRHALFVTETLRKATMQAFDEHVNAGSGDLPPVLSGHGFETPSWEQALYLALPHVGRAHADGRLHGAAIVLPPSATDLAAGVRLALSHVRALRLPGGRVISIAPYAGERSPLAAVPRRWSMPSTHFVSALPVVHERFRKGGPNLQDVTMWCRHAGLTDPVAFRSSRLPLTDGAITLRPHEVYRPQRPRMPYSHVQVRFAEPVRGPVVLGRFRTLGLGLLMPVKAQVADG
ncbi:MAG: type I-G CRISPR-associated protein Csb2 [Acidimicrobiales bacterium]